MILNDKQIAELCTTSSLPMIYPFVSEKRDYPSYGVSSFGYDIRLGHNFRIVEPVSKITNWAGPQVIDPVAFDKKAWRSVYKNDYLDISPHGFVLAESVEKFVMPDDVLAICVGKSTYARCGLIVNVTPLEPGWRGILTLELSNTTDHYIRVYVNRGISQLMFFRGQIPETGYTKGRYQNQTGVTFPRR